MTELSKKEKNRLRMQKWRDKNREHVTKYQREYQIKRKAEIQAMKEELERLKKAKPFDPMYFQKMEWRVRSNGKSK